MRKRQWRRKGIAARPFSGNSGLSYDSSQMETGRPREKMQTHRRACSTGQLLGLFSSLGNTTIQILGSSLGVLYRHIFCFFANTEVAQSPCLSQTGTESQRTAQDAHSRPGKSACLMYLYANAYLHSYVRVCMKSNTRIRMVFYCRITHFFMQSRCLPSI
ncbi:putative transmembrane protein [Toxoplasma gondii VAND]|uniref:Putative transmembrane protein n=1 Tax=Toxoplasma gondii VAND TaxID=933077 RepID=A0A086PGT5_TOXGO|nr:putative transmembrane protein [Toxoplasma gondii VAND]